MNSTWSIELPESIADLVTDQAFDRYTIAGPSTDLETRLRNLGAIDLFPDKVGNSEMASCCLSGLLLLHNFLDLSHDISQSIHSKEGSFWHAIMHRLERDFGNSKYWYRNVGQHLLFAEIPYEDAGDPFEFVDQCEEAQRLGGETAQTVQRIAVAEWKALFEFCFRQAGS